MANVYGASLRDLLRFSRREYIYHKTKTGNKGLIEYFGKQCLKYRQLLENQK